MKSKEEIIIEAYILFNKRDIEGVLNLLDAEVDWPNGMEGGIEHGHDAVRTYWTRQWKMVDPVVNPVQIKKISDDEYDVTVHQKVKNMEGELILDQFIHHVYYLKDGLIIRMEIVNSFV